MYCIYVPSGRNFINGDENEIKINNIDIQLNTKRQLDFNVLNYTS